MDDLECKTHIENGNMKIVKSVLVVMKAEKIATNLYMLKRETLEEAQEAIASEKTREESTMLWHKKLGHMSEPGLKILSEHGLLPSLTKVSLPFCEHCVTSSIG